MWLPSDDPGEDEWPEFDVPQLTVYPNDVEPLILYGPTGVVLVSWTPPIGFARAYVD